jgi:hypothetical protein
MLATGRRQAPIVTLAPVKKAPPLGRAVRFLAFLPLQGYQLVQAANETRSTRSLISASIFDMAGRESNVPQNVS